MSNSRKIAIVLLLVIIMVIMITACKGGNRQQKDDQQLVEESVDSSLIFNGKSLDGWEITNFGPQGPVSLSDGRVILGMGDGCTGINWTGDFPATDYKVTLEAMRVNGNDFFCGMTFPAGDDYCSLIVGGWAGTIVGLSCIDGRDASENITTSLMKFERKHWYNICLEVTENNIKAMIDSMEVVNFTIGDSKLSVRPEVELSKPFGIASWNTTAAIRNIRLQRLSN
jgi:hypothetical protein